ncbi:MAG: diacylglycerol kinase family protein [Candidatus Weimeria sp.]
MASSKNARDPGRRRHEPVIKSFGYAFAGIWECIRDERNIRIHLVMTALVVIGGIVLKISLQEWIVCLVLFGLVISLELVNTAVESTVDLVTDEVRPLAKKAKDTAAGAVLVSAIIAAIIGLIIFVPKIIAFFS